MEHKSIVLPPITAAVESQVRKSTLEKPKKTRVFAENQVLIQAEDYFPEKQWQVMFEETQPPDDDHLEYVRTTINRHMCAKLNGYKTQDQKNTILDTENFVDIDFVMDLLKKSAMKCFYCREQVQLLYKHVREPKQWTLERIDNSIGHNRGNVEIACLSCNLRRRCIYHERFLFTKQMKIVKSPGGGNPPTGL